MAKRKPFTIINVEEEIEAVDEQHARELFFNNTIYDTQSDPASFIDNHLKIKKKYD